MPKITPCLWFDDEALPAAELYTAAFPNSRIVSVTTYDDDSPRAGQAMLVVAELDGTPVQLLNGGPGHPHSWAVSFSIDCADQAEVDHYWSVLGEGGEESQCGWLKDRFGFWWQVVPRRLVELMQDGDPARAKRVWQAMLGMGKIDVAELERAADAAPVG